LGPGASKIASTNAAAARSATRNARPDDAQSTKATGKKVVAAEPPYAEALAGLLQMAGQTVALGGDVKSTRGASLTALSNAVGSLTAARVPEASAVPQRPVRFAAVIDTDDDGESTVAPEAKRSKISNLAKTIGVHGGGSAASEPPMLGEDSLLVATPALRSPPLTASQRQAFAVAADVAKKRAEGMTRMVGARRLLKARVKALTGAASKSTDSFLSPRMRSKAMIEAVRDYAKYTESQATDFLLEKVLKPTRHTDNKKHKRDAGGQGDDDSSTTGGRPTICVNHKLKEGLSHVYGDLKRCVVGAWFHEASGYPKSSMVPRMAATWLHEEAYFKQPGGRRAILGAATKGYKYLGALNRVQPAASAGCDAVVDLTCGFLVLIIKFVGEELVSVRDGTSVKQGPDLNGYKDYVAEFLRLDSWMPKHSRVESGMRLCDGDDPHRAVFDAEYVPVEDGRMTVGHGREGGEPISASAHTLAATSPAVESPATEVHAVAVLAAAAPAATVREVAVPSAETYNVSFPAVSPPIAMTATVDLAAEPVPPVMTQPTAAVPAMSAQARAAAIMEAAQAQAAAILAQEDLDELL